MENLPLDHCAYKIVEPEALTSSVVFASPHSGRAYQGSFLKSSILDDLTIRSSEDAYVDQLIACVPGFGAPLLTAKAPRSFLDLNRAEDELDPALITGVPSAKQNPRIASGLGIIPRVVANGRAIYRGKMSKETAQARIDTYWKPYHKALKALLARAQTKFGRAILIDVHSMPHEAVAPTGRSKERTEIVVGDRFGASAESRLAENVLDIFSNHGFRVARNAPFAGAYITQRYGRPHFNQHVLQIEIDRALYLNEANITPSEQFEFFRQRLRKVLAEIAKTGATESSLAAE